MCVRARAYARVCMRVCLCVRASRSGGTDILKNIMA